MRTSLPLMLYTISDKENEKVEPFLRTHRISYVKKNVLKEPLTPKEIQAFLRYTDNGLSDLIRSGKRLREIAAELEKRPLSRAISYLIHNPDVLRMPILYDESKQKALFSCKCDELTLFIPRNQKKATYFEMVAAHDNSKKTVY